MRNAFQRHASLTSGAILLLALTAAALLAQTDMTGFWELRYTGAGVSYLDLEQKGETVQTVPGRGGRGGVAGSLHDGKLELRSVVNRPPAALGVAAPVRETVYEGVAQGRDLFAITTTTTGRPPAKATLRRVSREEAHPARLPLPELHDVPDNGLVRTPPMGWNSWNKFHDRFDDRTVREMADALVSSGMAKAGYTYLVVDEGWTSGRDANGKIVGNSRFPDMKALADYIHSKGLKAGIYSSPGPQSCSGDLGGGYQGSYGHEEDDAKTFADWGYDYLKYDWCSAGGVYSSTREEEQGAYQKMGDALSKTGRSIVYSLCSTGPPTSGNGAPKQAAIFGAPPSISATAGNPWNGSDLHRSISRPTRSLATGTIPTCWR